MEELIFEHIGLGVLRSILMIKKLLEKNLELVDGTYYGSTKVDGVNAEILIDTAGQEKRGAGLIEFSNEFIVWLQKNRLVVKKFAAKKLVTVKNTHWLEPKEKPVTESGFVKKMKLQSITINYDKTALLFYDVGKLFGDHSAIVEVDKKYKLSDAHL